MKNNVQKQTAKTEIIKTLELFFVHKKNTNSATNIAKKHVTSHNTNDIQFNAL